MIEVRLDLRENAPLRDPRRRCESILERVVADATHYVLIDEVLEAISLAEFRDVRHIGPALHGAMCGFSVKGNLEVFATMSNSRFLSTCIMTEFRDRGIEVRVHPLSFAEYVGVRQGDPRHPIDEYLTYGGLHMLAEQADQASRQSKLAEQAD